MNVEIEETGPVERKLRIEIPTADVDAAFEGVYGKLRKSTRIHGFRPGKAPRSVLERYFGAQARHEVLERLVQETLAKAVEQTQLPVIGEPQLGPGDPPEQGQPFAYEVVFDIRPEIELKRVTGLEVHAPEPPEPEQDPIEAHLSELLYRHSQLVEEPEGTASARGHQAVIDYRATVEGQPFEGGSGDETVVELGEGRAIAGLEDQLLGLRVRDEREFDLELPESYPVESVAGKSAHFQVKLVGLKRRELPELDDEFAKDVSDFETLSELRADLEERLRSRRESEKQSLLRESVIEALIEANPFPVPESLVERQLSSRIARAAGQLRELPEEELRKLVREWRDQWRPQAERDVRFALLADEIAKREAIEVTDGELDAELQTIAEQTQQTLSQLKRSYREQSLLDPLRGSLRERRVVDFLLSEATVSES